MLITETVPINGTGTRMASSRALAAIVMLLVPVIVGSTGCALGSRTSAPVTPPAAPTATVRCTETTATPPDGRPAVIAETTRAWFGQGDLWVGLPDYPAITQGDSLVLRFPWVTVANGIPTSELGPPSVTASRSDAPGDATGQVGGFTRAFGTGELTFWPATMAFPAPGCWTVTGTLGATSVQFVVRVDRP